LIRLSHRITAMDDDIDVFAELGVAPMQSAPAAEDDDLLGLLVEHDTTGPSAQVLDPLAALMDDEAPLEEPILPVVDAEPIPPPEAPPTLPVVDAKPVAPTHSLSESMLSNIVALLVERGLGVDPRRLGLPNGADVVVHRVNVERDHDLLVARADVRIDGTPMHPFAAVRLTNNGAAALPAPESLPPEWHPMHDALAACLADGAQQLDAALGGAWRA
jgi:hypothetical protein